MQTRSSIVATMGMVCFALSAGTATAARSVSASPRRVAGDTVAAFSPESIRVEADTTWFIPEVEQGQTRVPMAAYVPRSHQWLLVERSWPQVATTLAERHQSENVHAPGVQNDSLSYGWHLDDDYVRKTADNSQSVLVGPDNARFPIAVRLSTGSRRTLYRRAGGGRAQIPPFSTLVSRWTAHGDLLALATLSEPPPGPEAPWLPVTDTTYDATLSAVILFDTRTRRFRQLVHPALVERAWIGLELAGDALWIAPTALADSNQTYADAPARKTGPLLMRYDLRSSRWFVVPRSAIPISGIRAMGGDGTRLYFIGDAALATMDTKTRRWNVRYLIAYSDTTSDGADTTMVALSPRRRDSLDVPVPSDRDSVAVIAAFARELSPRHLTRFERALGQYASYDSLEDIVSMMDGERGGRWDTGDLFVTETARAQAVLAQPEFEPYLKEALSRPSSLSFALTTLADIRGVDVRAELRATMDSAPVPAALMAADTLVQLHDSAAVVWLEAQLEHPERLADAAPGPGGPWIDIVRRLLRAQQSRQSNSTPERM